VTAGSRGSELAVQQKRQAIAPAFFRSRWKRAYFFFVVEDFAAFGAEAVIAVAVIALPSVV